MGEGLFLIVNSILSKRKVARQWGRSIGAPKSLSLVISIDARPTREIEHQYVGYLGGLLGWSTVMRTKRPLITFFWYKIILIFCFQITMFKSPDISSNIIIIDCHINAYSSIALLKYDISKCWQTSIFPCWLLLCVYIRSKCIKGISVVVGVRFTIDTDKYSNTILSFLL